MHTAYKTASGHYLGFYVPDQSVIGTSRGAPGALWRSRHRRISWRAAGEGTRAPWQRGRGQLCCQPKQPTQWRAYAAPCRNTRWHHDHAWYWLGRVRRRLGSAKWVALSALVSIAAPAEAAEEQPAAETEHRLVWQPEWRRFDLVEYVATAAVVGAYYAVELEAPKPTEANWSSGFLIDDGVRSPLVGSTRTARNRAADFGDYLFLVPPAWAILDGIITPLATDRGNLDIAWHMTAMNIQAVGLVGLLTRAGHRYIARARPDVTDCEKDKSYDQVCLRGSYASFPSGHTSAAGVGAGLICAHHLNLPLYGGGAPDILACGVNVGMTALIGYSRLIADRHYVSDVVVGAGLGFGVGFGLPVLLHYQSVGTGYTDDGLSWTVAPYGTASSGGVQVVGGF